MRNWYMMFQVFKGLLDSDTSDDMVDFFYGLESYNDTFYDLNFNM
jgi:hypothetical protein